MQQITIKKVQKPQEKNIKKDIDWICDSFALSSGRDIGQMTKKVISSIIKNFSRHAKVSSEKIADELDINQSMVNHHLRNLSNSGMIYRERKSIMLNGGSLKAAVNEMRKDTNRLFDDIEEIAEEIDKDLGLKNR